MLQPSRTHLIHCLRWKNGRDSCRRRGRRGGGCVICREGVYSLKLPPIDRRAAGRADRPCAMNRPRYWATRSREFGSFHILCPQKFRSPLCSKGVTPSCHVVFKDVDWSNRFWPMNDIYLHVYLRLPTTWYNGFWDNHLLSLSYL